MLCKLLIWLKKVEITRGSTLPRLRSRVRTSFPAPISVSSTASTSYVCPYGVQPNSKGLDVFNEPGIPRFFKVGVRSLLLRFTLKLTQSDPTDLDIPLSTIPLRRLEAAVGRCAYCHPDAPCHRAVIPLTTFGDALLLA